MREKIKLVVSDMDGTMLSPLGVLDPVFFDIYPKMKSQGVFFVAASGRQYYNLIKIFDKIKDEIYFIAENGTYVMFKGEELSVSDIPKNYIGQIIDEVREIKRAYPILCGKKSAYIERNNNPDFEEFAAQGAKYYERCEVIDDLKEFGDDQILKVAIYDFLGSSTNCWNDLQHFNGDLKVVVSGQSWLDISHKDANKGVALELLQSRLGIDIEETMVFGDQMNDAEMMERGYYSYAVDNAVDGVKAVSNFVAPSNVDNGVVKVLKKFFM